MSVLDDIIAGVREDLKEREDRVPLARIKEMETQVPEAKDVLGALRGRDGAVKIISEVKRSSPSKGALAAIPDPAALAPQRTRPGEPRSFRCSLSSVAFTVRSPILMRYAQPSTFPSFARTSS